MDFGIGYRWRAHESNLLLSVRLPPDESGGADATSWTPPAESASPKLPRVRKPPPVDPPRRFFWFSR